MKFQNPVLANTRRHWIALSLMLALLVAWTSAFAQDKVAKKKPLPKAPKNLQISAPSKPLQRGRTGASPQRMADLKTAGDRLAEAKRAVSAYQQMRDYTKQQADALPAGPAKNAMFAKNREARDQLNKWNREGQRRQAQFNEAANDYVFSHNKWTANNPRPDAPDAPQATPAPRGITPNPAAFPRAVSPGGPPPVAVRRQAQAVASGAAAPRPRFEPIAAGPEPETDGPDATVAAPVGAAADAADPDDPPPPFNPAVAAVAAQSAAAQPDLSAIARQAAQRAAQRPTPALPPRAAPRGRAVAGANPGQRVVYDQLPAVADQAPGGGLQQRDARAGPARQAAGLLRGVANALAASEQVLVSPR
ncbi:MAG: hypothetical protein ACT4PZ_11885 [Panacagrimonas sp.]